MQELARQQEITQQRIQAEEEGFADAPAELAELQAAAAGCALSYPGCDVLTMLGSLRPVSQHGSSCACCHGHGDVVLYGSHLLLAACLVHSLQQVLSRSGTR